ncbi:MAG: hypothetical protein AAGI01_03550 [Myxococcota bacterium]
MMRVNATTIRRTAFGLRRDDALTLDDATRRTHELEWCSSDDEEVWAEAFVLSAWTHGLADVPAPIARAHFEARRALWQQLTLKKCSLETRRDRAVDHLVEHIELYSGWRELVWRAEEGGADEHALGAELVWWRFGPFETVRQRKRLLEQRAPSKRLSEEFEAAGFQPFSQHDYREQVRVELIEELLAASSSQNNGVLDHLARIILFMTTPHQVLTAELFEGVYLLEEDTRALVRRALRQWRKDHAPTMVALPRDPLATLTRETNNLGRQLAGERSAPGSRGIKYHRDLETGQMSLLSYDAKLVLKGTKVPDTYIKIPMEVREGRQPTNGSELSSLLEILHEAKELTRTQRQHFLRDAPRVIAGMFLAAERDQALGGAYGVKPGEFLESETAYRLTDLIGLERRSRHTKRVIFVRDWLTRIHLTRTVDRLDHRGKRERIRWSAPIVQRLADEIEVERSMPDGLGSVRSKVHIWRLADALWRMRTRDSGVAAFMLVDERAFALSTETSDPFNLYWTIIQRAYKGSVTRVEDDKVRPDGVFSPKIATLYEWSGMASTSLERNPSRIRERMRDYLSLMVSKGLLLDWSSEWLEHDGPFQRRVFETSRVRLTMPSSMVRYINHVRVVE